MKFFLQFVKKCLGQFEQRTTSSTLVIVEGASNFTFDAEDESFPINIKSNRKKEKSLQQILELLDPQNSGSDDEFSSTEEHNQNIKKAQKLKKMRKKNKSHSPEELLFRMDDF